MKEAVLPLIAAVAVSCAAHLDGARSNAAIYERLNAQTTGATPAPRGAVATKRNAPSMHELSSFAFFATSGTFRAYKMGTGELLDEQELEDLRDGSLRFAILGERRGMIMGNQGAGEVEIFRTPESISLVEKTISGNKHVFTVRNGWDSQRGFPATYVRTIEVDLTQEVLRSTYSGFVRPSG